MTSTISRYFPKDKAKWKMYLRLFLPAFLGSTMFALNSFVDNFMVGHISQGVTALSAVNSWTNIIIGIFSGVSAAGSVIIARYYHLKKYDLVKQVAHLRHLVCLFFTLILSSIAWIDPKILINVFLESSKDIAYQQAYENARSYIRIIAFSWILIAMSSNYGNQLRELGHAKITMFWGMGTLSTHIILNAVLIYGFGFGVAAAAVASVCARSFAIMTANIYILVKKIPLFIMPLNFVKISWKVWKKFFQRWFLFVSFSSLIFFVTFRNFFFDAGYPAQDHSPLGNGLGAMIILGLSGAIQNVFTNTFQVLGVLAANFVRPEITHKRYSQARENADELKGFTTLICLILAILLFVIATFIPYMTFLSPTLHNNQTIDHKAHLNNVRLTLYVVTFYYPFWMWTMMSSRAAVSGRRGFWFSFSDWMISGPLQLSWLAILIYVIKPNWPFLQTSFALTYFLFFISDLLKLVVFEILYHKLNWDYRETAKNKTKNYSEMA